MLPLTPQEAAEDRVYVALDLETTGLEPDRCRIIEVGAVKFRGAEALDVFQTYVNPYTAIPPFIQRLTGIRQRDVDRAPPFAAVAGKLAQFVGSHPIVGHNVSFDMEFLAKHELPLSNPTYDTWDMAATLLPGAAEYSLPLLSKALGVDPQRSHRALDDAQTTRGVFLCLLERARGLDPAVSNSIRAMALRAKWGMRDLLNGADAAPAGIDMRDLRGRLTRPAPLRRSQEPPQPLDDDALRGLVSSEGLLSRAFPGFEHRPEQAEMISAVTESLNNGGHLMVEGGTGVGKTVAYLLPSILHAVKNGARVVVSTNTINLQEQLLQKDIPALDRALQEGGELDAEELRAVGLKGRANYLCARRWTNLSRSDGLSVAEARLLSKCLVWLQDTSSGDRSEINLAGRDSFLWGRVSAGDKGLCPGLREGGCFLRAARDRAEAAHVVVVNHALLLSDLARGGGLIPEYQHLIIDEAHHLEEQATQQLGFQASQGWLQEQLDAVFRAVAEGQGLLRRASLSPVQESRAKDLIGDLEGFAPHLRTVWSRMWGLVEEFVRNHQRESDYRVLLRISRSSRAQPDWSDLEIAWENCDVALAEAQKKVERLYRHLDVLSLRDAGDWDTLASSFENWLEEAGDLRGRLRTLVSADFQDERIDWVAQERDSTLVFHSAPLDVGPTLKSELFDQKESVVLSSATLTAQGSFNFIRHRLGLEEAEELRVGSPFDYKRAALLAIADDIPPPGARGYREALERGLAAVVKETRGHTLALFTSHSALRAARQTLIETVEEDGIPVLAQGVDGSPHRVMRRFIDNPASVLLGASSFWEGVDMPSGVLKALVLAKLPFNVPSDPIFAARGEQYDNSFSQYAVPKAVLRFRQGFGRLIRNARDRGVVLVLDRRVLTKSYGRAFLDSLPECTLKIGPMASIAEAIGRW